MPDYRKSVALYEEGQALLAGGVSSNFRYGTNPVPLFYARGEGSRLYDVDGNGYIDYGLGNGPVILGHAPARVLDAVGASFADGQLYAGQHRRELDLARAISRHVPCAELMRFSSSGSEAVHLALRLARAFTGRAKIVKFEGHFHGWLDNIYASVRPSPNAAGPVEAPIVVGETPGQPESALTDLVALPWNDLDAVANVLERQDSDIAGMIMEPIMCNTCVIPPRPGYLEGVRELCDRHGVVLIFDEVITGFRLGLGGGQAKVGVVPDLAVFAKAIASGFPLGCVAGRREVMELVLTKGVMHGGTYNSNVVCVAAAMATIAALEENDGQAFRTMDEIGSRIMDGVKELAAEHRVAMRIQGFGGVFHTAFTEQDEITDYRSFLGCDQDLMRRFVSELQDAGVRLTTRGTWFLSGAHDSRDAEETLVAVDSVLGEIGSAS